MTQTALYRHYDADGALLYVGISNSPVYRLDQHGTSALWHGSIARVTMEWHETRRDAERAERIAIRDENPIHNIRRDPVLVDVELTGWRADLADLISASGKSMRAVSLEAGAGAGYVHSILKDGKDPTIDAFLRICAALDVKPSDLLDPRP